MPLPPRWVVAVSAAVATAILGDSLLYAVLPTVWPQLGLEVGMVGVLLSANRLVRLASNPVAGWAYARAGVRRPFLAAVFVAAATTAAYASGRGFLVLLAARALWGVCWSFLRLGGYLAALDASSDHNRGYYLGFFNGVTRLGSFVAVLAGGVLTDLLGFQTTVALFTALTLSGGLAVLRERPVRASSLPRRAPAPDAAPDLSEAPRRLGDRKAPARRKLWTVYTFIFLHGLALNGLVTSTLGFWLLTAYGATVQIALLTLGVATLTGALLSSRFLGDALWGPLSGHLSDRYGRVPCALIAGAVEAGALVALAMGGGLSRTVAAVVALFLAGTALQVTLDAQAGGLAPPAARARTMSWYATWFDLGAALGPLVGYQLGVVVGLASLYQGAAVLLVALGSGYAFVFRDEVWW